MVTGYFKSLPPIRSCSSNLPTATPNYPHWKMGRGNENGDIVGKTEVTQGITSYHQKRISNANAVHLVRSSIWIINDNNSAALCHEFKKSARLMRRLQVHYPPSVRGSEMDIAPICWDLTGTGITRPCSGPCSSSRADKISSGGKIFNNGTGESGETKGADPTRWSCRRDRISLHFPSRNRNVKVTVSRKI